MSRIIKVQHGRKVRCTFAARARAGLMKNSGRHRRTAAITGCLACLPFRGELLFSWLMDGCRVAVINRFLSRSLDAKQKLSVWGLTSGVENFKLLIAKLNFERGYLLTPNCRVKLNCQIIRNQINTVTVQTSVREFFLRLIICLFANHFVFMTLH